MERPPHLEILALMDQSPLREALFPPAPGKTPCPPKVTEFLFGSARNLKAHFYPGSPEMPVIFLVHDVGETLADYPPVGHAAQQAELSLFVFDPRGCGESPGRPSMKGLLEDSLQAFALAQERLPARGYSRPLVVMGRGLGTVAALEIERQYGPGVAAVILVSTFVNPDALLLSRGLNPQDFPDLPQGFMEGYIQNLSRPIMVVHAQHDRYVPLSEVEKFLMYAQVGNKRLMIIPGADFLDRSLLAEEGFFQMVSDFLHWLRPKRRRRAITLH